LDYFIIIGRVKEHGDNSGEQNGIVPREKQWFYHGKYIGWEVRLHMHLKIDINQWMDLRSVKW
jgi:hypothetical protein